MIGRYRIDGLLGEGAMAHVYLAHDSAIDRRLAVKVLKPALRDDTEVVRRFLAESRAAGMLSHAAIVTIHDVGEADGIPYIAMEYLDGEPLDMVLERQGRLSSEHVLALGAQIASALALAHTNNVIHRDVKPSNIIICDKGKSAKLVDFGIARVDDADDDENERTARRTQFGQIMGTPRYMSPEQAMGMPLDARSDLFSFGSILFEMITGKPAFPGSGLATLALQIAQQRHAPVASHTNDCSKGLSFIIDKLLAKNPGDRFASADAVYAALVRESEGLRADTGRFRRGIPLRIAMPLGLSAVTAIALAASVLFVLDRQQVALSEMAIASGSSTTDFMARNVALRMAENAGLAPDKQDWVPLQAFVEAAAQDSNVRSLRVVDGTNTVRASGDNRGIGMRVPPVSTTAASTTAAVSVATPGGFHFARPIRYAGADFGRLDMELGRGTLDVAIDTARTLLLSMAAFVIVIVFLAGYFAARQLTQPLIRLRAALDDVAGGNASFRLSRRRRDEIGDVFDAFNGVAAAVEDLGESSIAPADLGLTRIEPAPAQRKAA